MEIQMGEVLKILIFILLAILLIINSILSAKKTQAACKLDYLNNVLNDKNLSTYVLVKKFLFATKPKPFPVFKEENVSNFSYRMALKEVDEADKNMNRANFTLGIIIFTLACILGIAYPETVQEIFRSTSS
ncbi:MAG: hypothetical protein ABJF11_04880 [Reichenbachiella sp.]|uniref:hypothetical protein n=1 Tax=Reichenbachiella sp. TaxID=2184521 RepID=UPI003262F38A